MLNIKNVAWVVFFLPMVALANVSEFQLENGLKLIVKEDHRAPVVVSQVWYKVGSSYEHNGITGISHMLEHMMFKGTKHLEPNEFSHIIAENGGEQNAFTGQDYTAYFQKLHKDRLEVSFKHEADRMRNLIIDPEELLKEREVVTEERRMRTDDNPQSLLREQFSAAAFVSSPYHWPVIGWMNDIKHYQAEDLRAWYKKWYAPNNATLVVVGDVSPKAVLALAKKYFGPLKAEKIAALKPQEEITQKGLRQVEVKAPAELPYLMMGWKVPSVTTVDKDQAWEPYALEVLANVLDGGNSARFAKQLVREQQVAASVGAGNSLFSRLSDLFIVAGTPANDKSVDDLKKAIIEQISQLKNQPVSHEELARVKAQVVANAVYEKDSVFYQAMQIGMLETIGVDWQVGEQYVDNIKAVTAEQVQAVANKYFNNYLLTVGELVPLPLDGHRPVSSAGGQYVH
ncbi:MULTISPECIES: M16 family metallopeptidase [unclassified Methylophaga]|uniref:M16 family metallopeptidase n=1 Tax=unclassified Methylophaga TaxID=2629249 RepID=UPI000C587A84|nr:MULTISPECIES: pitrilysin family protein [unclassified Methylophaga]MAX53286.1 peptidase M16 [Methylophaga sp.]